MTHVIPIGLLQLHHSYKISKQTENHDGPEVFLLDVDNDIEQDIYGRLEDVFARIVFIEQHG